MIRLVGALVVVTPQDVAHLDGRKVLDMLRSAGVRVIGGVENMAGLACPHCGEEVVVFPSVRPERSIWNEGVTRLVSIPLDPAVASPATVGSRSSSSIPTARRRPPTARSPLASLPRSPLRAATDASDEKRSGSLRRCSSCATPQAAA